MKEFKRLFEPVSIGGTTVKNRIAMAPMGLDYMVNSDGSFNQRAVDYYLERVRNEVGMIICSCFKVENQIEALEESAPQITERGSGYLGELCDAAHSYGARIFVQLTAGFGRVTAPSTLRAQPVSASKIPNHWDADLMCRELATREVEKIVSCMGDAAEKLVVAGVDGVELHGHGGYLFDQFTAAIWNKRNDKYGGDLSNRLRFPIECLHEIRKRVGNRLAVQYRFGLRHYIKDAKTGILPGEKAREAGRDLVEGLKMASMLEAVGFDALHVDAGCYESRYWYIPPIYQKHGCMVDMPAKVKDVVKIPVIAVGRLDLPELALNVIEEGMADMVALGRGLLADPEWALKVKTGNFKDIRPCIGCLDSCVSRYKKLKPISCSVNPSSGRERFYRLAPIKVQKRVSVIGGGVAGMEAARVAALRGHKVTLYEKEKELGGIVRVAAIPKFKSDLNRLLAWYESQLVKAGAGVELKTEVTPDLFARQKPEVVFVAIGAQPIIPEIPGIERESVTNILDLFLGKKEAGGETVIIGGGLTGCEAAIWLAEQGKIVTVVEMLPKLMVGGNYVPYEVDLMTTRLMAANNINIITGAKVTEITPNGALIVQSDHQAREIKAGTVVLAVGLKADNKLFHVLAKEFDCIYALGDCREPNNITQAIWDAYEVARSI